MLFRASRGLASRLGGCLAPLAGVSSAETPQFDVFFSPTARQSRRSLAACGATAAAAAAESPSGGVPPVEPWAHAGQPIEGAATPPSSWYTQPAALEREERTIFQRSWLAVAHASQLAAPGAYAAGSLLRLQWLACRDEQGRLRAFHNVCRHHAAILAEGAGTATCFRCPYHGWTYGLDGRLQRATRLKGIEGFRAADHGLLPLDAGEWGGLVWVRQRQHSAMAASQQEQHGQQQGQQGQQHQQQQQVEDSPQLEQQPGVAAWLGAQGSAAALAAGLCDSLVHVARREYVINCNWKVFVDNYLDGGYHVSVAHPQLASGLDLSTYRSDLYERLSIQSCQPAAAATGEPDKDQPGHGQGSEQNSAAGAAQEVVCNDSDGSSSSSSSSEGQQERQRQRLAGGRPPAYIYIYPNLMLNRYGPWLDSNIVVPLAADRCKVLFDYYLEPELADDKAFIAESLAASHQVQLEDVALCESVQRGLASPGYDTGRYAPGVETPMHHFHSLLHADLTR